MAGKKRALSFPESVRAILCAQTPDEELQGTLSSLGLKPTVLNAIHWGICGKAIRGDPSAAKYLRDTLEGKSGETATPGSAEPDLPALTDGELRELAAQLGDREGI